MANIRRVRAAIEACPANGSEKALLWEQHAPAPGVWRREATIYGIRLNTADHDIISTSEQRPDYTGYSSGPHLQPTAFAWQPHQEEILRIAERRGASIVGLSWSRVFSSSGPSPTPGNKFKLFIPCEAIDHQQWRALLNDIVAYLHRAGLRRLHVDIPGNQLGLPDEEKAQFRIIWYVMEECGFGFTGVTPQEWEVIYPYLESLRDDLRFNPGTALEIVRAGFEA